jgi:hypothetical protein
VRNDEQVVIESGECNFRFRFKLVSIERVAKIFDEIRHCVATDNLESTPRAVTLDPKKVKHLLKPKRLGAAEDDDSSSSSEASDQEGFSVIKRKPKRRDYEIPDLLKASIALHADKTEEKRYASMRKNDPDFKKKQSYDKIQSIW